MANTDGKPIGGGTITLSSPILPDYQKEIAADKKGKFQIEVPKTSFPYELRFSKMGLQVLLFQVQPVEGAITSVDAVMVRSEVRQPEKQTSTGQSAAAAYEQALAALKAGDSNTAVEKLQHVVELAADVAEPHAFLAQALLEQGENAAAAAEAERALDPMSPRSAPA